LELLSRIEKRSARVGVIGLGYVGLPLALRAAEAGFLVTGVDIDEDRVATLFAGASSLLDVSSEQLAAQLDAKRFVPTTDTELLSEADVILICVPTPLKHELPDMSFIESAAKEVARTLRFGQLVILESTTYPGTTEEFLKEILESNGMRAGADFFLGFSPERIDPGNSDYGIANVPKIVGGIDDQSTTLMEAFYGALVDKVVRVSSPRAAEMAKLLENTYRHINIALVNEIAILCHDLGIDVWEVIDAAATKPFGFQAFYPGPGWGGHCIPVDPAYLSWRVKQLGETAHFVELAREINKRMPAYVVQRIGECLNDRGKSLKDSWVMILGVAYKAGIDDIRESPAIEIISRLRKSGAEVCFHDPYVEQFTAGDITLDRVDLSNDAIRRADIVVIHTDHPTYDWASIASTARLVLDTRNALKGLKGPIVRL
jgi:UDP-N-acetyl-D-glucosamine dehydrogenase